MTGNILVLGATGMLGRALVGGLTRAGHSVWSTVREPDPCLDEARTIAGVDARDFAAVDRAVRRVSPSVVINAIGVVKHVLEGRDPINAIEVNALLPHRLASLCRSLGARLVHVSTDCVFSGRRGRYHEQDSPDPEDLYGYTKLLGEVDGPGVLTIRTSVIGHEQRSRRGLVEWFLAQRGGVEGYAGAIYSGLPTCEFVRVIVDHVLPGPALEGVYHVASAPISKYELLRLVARAYGVDTAIRRNDTFRCDRSLVAERFHAATGYVAPPWPELVAEMHRDYLTATGREASVPGVEGR
jgi:dTDP-4-dehydrorhamnose reductase